jgi:hypothetical protein
MPYFVSGTGTGNNLFARILLDPQAKADVLSKHAPRRKASRARRFAAFISHAAGFSGIPFSGVNGQPNRQE